MAEQQNPQPTSREALNRAAVEAQNAALSAGTNSTLGSAKGAIAEAWQGLYGAILETKPPDPAVAGSHQAFQRRLPLLQQWLDYVRVAEQLASRGAGFDADVLKAQVASVERELQDQHAVEPVLKFGTSAAQAQFDQRTKELHGRADEVAGAAAGKLRSPGQPKGAA
ncbi:hypothetical protein ABS71_10510 [bacterium SCN 62-11]|nr:MAG: hypothetical protein ABS71_10510 [bacterium SCN 62-11]